MSVILTITNPATGDSAIVDLYPDESISLNWKFTDIKDLSIRGSFSREFRVPGTDTNIGLFGPLFDVNYAGDFSFHKKAPAILTVDTIPVEGGHIQLKRCYVRRGTVAEFELVFFAETPDLVRALGSKKLNEIDYSTIDHDMDYSVVVAGASDWKYALADRGYRWSENGEPDTFSVLNENIWSVTPSRLTPILKSRWLFDKILSEAGFTYEGSEIESLLDGYWIPYVNSKANQMAVNPASYYFNVGALADITGFTGNAQFGTVVAVSEIFDNGGNFASNTFTVPFTAYYTFRMWSRVSGPTNGGYRYHRLITNGSYESYQSDGIPTGVTPNSWQSDDFTTILAQGDTVQFLIGETFNGAGGTTVTIHGDVNNDPSLGTGWALVSVESPLEGAPFSWAINAPDKTQAEFIKGILQMHNSVLIPDRNIPNKLHIEPVISYLAAGDTKDWTDKLDLSKDIVIAPTTDDQKKRLKFTYKQGSDILSAQYAKRGRVYGDYIVDGYTAGSAADVNDFATDELAIELPFESTPANPINGTSIVIPKWVGENGDFQNPGLRIVYIAGQATVKVYDQSVDHGVDTTVNLINNYSNVYAEVDDFDLNFAPEVPLHLIQGNPYRNLFNLYFREYLNEIYSPQARYMDAYFNLSLGDIIQFKFNDKIFIKDSYWRILEISEYKIGHGDVTKVRLMKILGLTPDCNLTPGGSTLGGEVDFVNGLGDPADPNEICCTRYGYTWNPDNEKCYSILPPPDAIIEGPSKGFGVVNGFSFGLANGSSIPAGNTQSIYAGFGLEPAQGNQMSIMIGDVLKMLGSNGATAMFGKNAKANISGLHLGGGWEDLDRTSAEGRAQGGLIMYSGSDDWTSSGDAIGLFPEGIRGKHLELLDETLLLCQFDVSIIKVTAGAIVAQGLAQFTVGISKSAGVAGAATVQKTYSTDNIGTFALTVDHTTNTAQHRFAITSTGGGGHPHNNIFLSATLKYTQTRHT